MENSKYPTENRRDYDDRQTDYGDGGPRRPHNQGGYGQRRGFHKPYNSEGTRQPYNSEGTRRPYNSEGPRRPYNGYGNPRDGYGPAPRRPYDSEEGGYDRSEGYGQRGGGSRRPYNPEGPHRPYNSEGSRRPYNSEDGTQRKPYNYNGYGKPHNNYGESHEGYGRPHRPYSGYGKPRDGYGPAPHNNERSAGGKGGLRPRKNSAPKPESGIDRMLKRKAQTDDRRFSDNDMVKLPLKEEVRLNKFIADSGICSRREADNFIVAGVVTVNGVVVTELGSKVNKFNDDVRFNGERLKGEAKVYIVMNKPKGFVTTTNDPHAEKTVMDLLKSCTARVTPVGRLDKNTTGVLMFTNDGEIAEKLTHPAYNKKKIYEVTLTSDLSQEDYEKILSGIPLSDGVIAADELEYVDEDNRKKLGIEIHSGKNRIVRRIFESLGYTVKSLDRVYFAGLTKKGIKRGAWRYLSEAEVNILKMGAYN